MNELKPIKLHLTCTVCGKTQTFYIMNVQDWPTCCGKVMKEA